MAVLEFDIPDAVHVDVVPRQIHQRERLIRIGIGVPREPEHAAVIEGHDGDASELRRRHIRWPASPTAATGATSTRALPRRRRLTSRRLPRPTECCRSDDTRRPENKCSTSHDFFPQRVELAGIIVGLAARTKPER